MSKYEKLKKSKSLSDLANLLGYSPKGFAYILYKIPEEKKYTEFSIPKKMGGKRDIKAPTDKLKLLQKHLSDLLYECYYEINKNNKPISHGFLKKQSIFENAIKHKNKRYVFNVDLFNFFPSINFGRVYGFFIKNKHFALHHKVATVIAQIACHNNELPQGSPCSPIISNLIGHLLDIRMVQLAKKAKCTYSRYADDLTFSTNKKDFPSQIALNTENNHWTAGDTLKNEIEKVGFYININKTNMQYRTSRQTTTGLVVNKFVNIKKEYYKKARSMCHSLFQSGEFYIEKMPSINESNESYELETIKDNEIKGSLHQLEGILSFIYQIKSKKNRKDATNKRRYNPNAITKLYREFLFYKHFFSLCMPLVIFEGGTDKTYIKCALENLESQYNELIEKKDNKFEYKISFLRMSKNLKDVFAIPEGTSALKVIIEYYQQKYMKRFKGEGMNYPVILLLDTDDGTDEIQKLLKKKDFNDPFCKVVDNLYVVYISDKKGLEIEQLFEDKVLKTKINGKPFNPKKLHGDESEYGKKIFSEKVIKENMSNINFDNFKPIFDKFKLVISDYRK